MQLDLDLTNPLKNLVGSKEDSPFTITRSGHKFYYAHFSLEDINLFDIASQLGATNRWVGALREFYSTAQHSVLLSKHALTCRESDLPENMRDRFAERHPTEATKTEVRREFARALLFHDAEEYVTGDFPGAIKQFFPLYIEYGNYVREMIFGRYGIQYGYYDWVKEWDRRILFTEAEWGLVGKAAAIREQPIVPSLNVPLYDAWPPARAADEFQKQYLRLS